MRKLATVRRIDEVAAIENADAIEKVRVGGWWVVAKKGEFKPGDLCVYFEIDSLLPPGPAFAFLEKGGRKKTIFEGRELEGYRLRTIKLRGQISQGLALPLTAFPGAPAEPGADVSEALGVVKYEPPMPADLAGEALGPLPGRIPKSDEERVQNCLDLLERHRGRRFYVTEKVDGTSATFYRHDGEFGACSRNLRLRESEGNAYWRVARERGLPESLPEGWALQGELAGEGIQKNPLRIKGQECFVFTVYNIASDEHLPLPEMREFAGRFGLPVVPVYDDNFILDHTCEQLLKLADMKSVHNPACNAEGLVFRLYEGRGKVSFKAISNRYLLGQD